MTGTEKAGVLASRGLPRTDEPISAVGLGAWAIGADRWGPQDDDDSVATLRAAIDQGITWIDTAPIYGFGHSEEIVGRAVAGRRDEVFLATKCTIRWDEARTRRRDGTAASPTSTST